MKNKEIKEFLVGNMEELKDAVRELNSWNGCMDYLDFYENDEEFFSMMFEGKPMEAVRAAHYGEYNYNDYYVRFNGYGNLESFSEYDLEQELKSNVDEVIENLIEHQTHVSLTDELEELLNAL